MMARRKTKLKKLGASGLLIGGAALVGGLVPRVREVIRFISDVNGALLGTSDFFHGTVTIAQIVSSVVGIVFLGGALWVIREELGEAWAQIRRAWTDLDVTAASLPLQNLVGAMFLVWLFAVVWIAFIPHRSEIVLVDANGQVIAKSPTQPTHKSDSARIQSNERLENETDLAAADNTISEARPKDRPTSEALPKDRMAGRDVCELFNDPTEVELRACIQDNLKHPHRRGTGGPVCLLINGSGRQRIECLPWPVPVPRPRPSFQVSTP